MSLYFKKMIKAKLRKDSHCEAEELMAGPGGRTRLVPNTWRKRSIALVGSFAVAFTVSVAPEAAADHIREDPAERNPAIEIASFCESYEPDALAGHRINLTNLSKRHTMSYYVEGTLGNALTDEHDGLTPELGTQLRFNSQQQSLPEGTYEFRLTWHGHDDGGADHVEFTTLRAPAIDCPRPSNEDWNIYGEVYYSPEAAHADTQEFVRATSGCEPHPETQQMNAFALAQLHNWTNGEIFITVDIPYRGTSTFFMDPMSMRDYKGNSGVMEIPPGEARFTIEFSDGSTESGSRAYPGVRCDEEGNPTYVNDRDPGTDEACPPDRVPPAGFTDTAGNTHERNIDCIVWWEITRGATPTTYAPTADVRRDQMASFLARMILNSGGTLPAASEHPGFADTRGNLHEDNIRRLAAAGVVAGTGPDSYAPTLSVRREQMATFLVRAYEYRTGETLTVTGNYFTDTAGSVHRDNINKAAEAAFASGTTATTFEPARSVRRDQMASFIARTLNGTVQQGHATPPG